jgi:tetratricopeptide (TPR) repeat protein
MQKREINKILKLAETNFVNRNYAKAMDNYSKLLSYIPNQEDAKIGVMLCDIAMESKKEDQAQAMFDFYTINKVESAKTAFEKTEELINSFDTNSQIFDSLFSEILGNRTEQLDGLTYKEFKQLAEDSNNFKKIFESVMFSTKIVIDNKTDLLSFIQDLLANEYYDMALEYLEMASKVLKNDIRVQEIANKLKVILNENQSK